jgi:hypothetical protein
VEPGLLPTVRKVDQRAAVCNAPLTTVFRIVYF